VRPAQSGRLTAVKFELTVDLDRVAGTRADELSRILRYWGGAAKKLDLSEAQEQVIYDSAYSAVGFWRISQSEPDSGQTPSW
jgi:hypothetical protein